LKKRVDIIAEPWSAAFRRVINSLGTIKEKSGRLLLLKIPSELGEGHDVAGFTGANHVGKIGERIVTSYIGINVPSEIARAGKLSA
jgi:hypothetical protein